MESKINPNDWQKFGKIYISQTVAYTHLLMKLWNLPLPKLGLHKTFLGISEPGIKNKSK